MGILNTPVVADPNAVPTTGALASPTAPTTTPAAPVSGTQISPTAPLPWDTQVIAPTADMSHATASTVAPNAMDTAVANATDPNSPLVRRARAMANEQSGSAGLLNSSMAVGSAENAVLNQAIPIAAQDVAAQEQNASLGTQVSTSNTAADNAAKLSTLSQENQVQLSGVNSKYQNELNTNAAASSLYSNIVGQIGTIQNNKDMDAATKQTAINQLMTQLQNGLGMQSSISGTDMSAGLDFSGNPGGLNSVTGATNTPAAPNDPHRPGAKTIAGNLGLTPGLLPLHMGGTNLQDKISHFF